MVDVWVSDRFYRKASCIPVPQLAARCARRSSHRRQPGPGRAVAEDGRVRITSLCGALFPEPAMAVAPWGMLMGVIGILYGGKLAFAQNDLKRLIAYTSVSHMGFVMLGVFAFTELAYQGVVMQMITHGI